VFEPVAADSVEEGLPLPEELYCVPNETTETVQCIPVAIVELKPDNEPETTGESMSERYIPVVLFDLDKKSEPAANESVDEQVLATDEVKPEEKDDVPPSQIEDGPFSDLDDTVQDPHELPDLSDRSDKKRKSLKKKVKSKFKKLKGIFKKDSEDDPSTKDEPEPEQNPTGDLPETEEEVTAVPEETSVVAGSIEEIPEGENFETSEALREPVGEEVIVLDEVTDDNVESQPLDILDKPLEQDASLVKPQLHLISEDEVDPLETGQDFSFPKRLDSVDDESPKRSQDLEKDETPESAEIVVLRDENSEGGDKDLENVGETLAEALKENINLVQHEDNTYDIVRLEIDSKTEEILEEVIEPSKIECLGDKPYKRTVVCVNLHLTPKNKDSTPDTGVEMTPLQEVEEAIDAQKLQECIDEVIKHRVDQQETSCEETCVVGDTEVSLQDNEDGIQMVYSIKVNITRVRKSPKHDEPDDFTSIVGLEEPEMPLETVSVEQPEEIICEPVEVLEDDVPELIEFIEIGDILADALQERFTPIDLADDDTDRIVEVEIDPQQPETSDTVGESPETSKEKTHKVIVVKIRLRPGTHKNKPVVESVEPEFFDLADLAEEPIDMSDLNQSIDDIIKAQIAQKDHPNDEKPVVQVVEVNAKGSEDGKHKVFTIKVKLVHVPKKP
jgi:hypothetical protein